MTRNRVVEDDMTFAQYVMGFYGPDGVYEMTPPATIKEVKKATAIRKQHVKEFSWGEGDSTDRELVRDVIKARRGSKKLEFMIVLKWL